MTTRAIGRRWWALAFTVAAQLTVQPGPAGAQTDAAAGREVRVLETVDPSTGRRALHVMEGLSPDEIRAVQRALSRAGFGEPWREGSLDPFTRGALQRFQTHRGLAVCACVSLETLIELDLRARVAETIVLEEPRRPQKLEPQATWDVAGVDDAVPPEATPSYVDYGRYYPYGVIYLTPYIHPYYDPIHAPRAGGAGALARRAASGLSIGARFGGVLVGGAVGTAPAIGSSAAIRPLGPFPRVAHPPNVVRGGG